MTFFPEFVKPLNEITLKAGEIIMGFYKKDLDITIKDDKSPVTQADVAANNFIVEELRKLTPDMPIVAEESKNIKISNNKANFWLVDPIDGTKSFIKKTGEFTVNIGLIYNGVPTMGFIYMPVKGVIYYTPGDGVAEKKVANNKPEKIAVRKKPASGYTVVASESHRTKETNDFIASLDKVDKLVSASSSIKLCLVAEGSADVYPRFGPTCEWDIGAGHAILRAAGGRLVTDNGENLKYGKPDYLNGNFIAWGNC